MVNKYFAEVKAVISEVGVIYEANIYRRRFDYTDGYLSSNVLGTELVGARSGASFDDLTDDVSMFLSTLNATADMEVIEFP